MNNKIRISVVALIVAAILVAVVARIWMPVRTLQPVTVSYLCKEGAAITAVYHQGKTTTPPPNSHQPPIPSGSVELHLSDGRSMTLPETISADGVRYANANESFIFWSRGNGALVLENDQVKSFIGCVAVAPESAGGLAHLYADNTIGYSIRFPQGYTIDPTYRYQYLGPGESIDGTKFAIPESMTAGTNLSDDTYLSVETIPETKDCSAGLFLGRLASSTTLVDDGTTYSIASSTGAAAGNRYEETVYALPGTNPCIAVRYFIHYGVLENYAPGMVKAFGKQALLDQFDAIRRTLVVAP